VVLGALGVVALLHPAGAAAQTATGNLRGYVLTGAGGTPVGEAQVVARSAATNQPRTTVTNATGFYYLGGLRPGEYAVTIRRVGFAPTTRTVQVPIAQTVDLRVTLAETAVQLSTVTVQAEATSTTRTSEVGTNVSREQIANLPNFERNVLDLAKLAPGVSSTTGDVNSTDKSFAAGGQPASAVNVFIDGATYKSDILPGGTAGQTASKGNPFPQAALDEFRVLTQNYKAEYQRASSAIIVATTRSGTNALAADAFAYGIGYGYSARDAYAARQGLGKPQYRRLQAGGSLGGPLVRDRLFLIGTYELNFRDDPAYVTLGGSAAQLPPGLNLARYTGQFQQEFRQHLGVAKLTYVAGERSTVDASVNVRVDRDFRSFGGQTAFENAVNLPIRVYTGIVNWRFTGDRWLNEAQFSPQQYLWQQIPVNPGIVGQNYDGVLQIGGNQASQRFTQNRFSFRDDVTRSGVRLGGDHVFKFGANVDLLGYRGEKDLAGNPRFTYNVSNNYTTPAFVQFGFGDPLIRTTNTQFGAYVQDDWTIGRRLTLNLGLRWDAETNPINNAYVTPRPLADSLRGALAGRLFVTRPNAAGGNDTVRVVDRLGGIGRFISEGRSSRELFLRAFQPRLGASYDLSGDGRTVLFGGGGIYYDRQNWNTFYDEQYRRQYGQYTVDFRSNCPTPVGCTAWDPRYLADPSTLRALVGNVGVPEVFLVANDLRPPRTTQASAGVRQAVRDVRVTLSYNGVFGRNITNYVRASGFGGLGPNYSTAFVTDDRVRTRYHSLQLQLERGLPAAGRFGGGLAYTLSRAEQQGNASDIFWFFDERYPTVADLPWRAAQGDQRHNLVANGIARLPGQFLLSGIVTLGSAITVNAADASQGTGPFQRRTYAYTPPGRPFLGFGRVFATQNLDLRLQKDLPVRGGQRVGLAVDLYNALGSTNFGCFNGDVPAPGQQNTIYGQPQCAAAGRRIQIGLNYGLRAARGASRTAAGDGATR
jgi:hypothetical protein